MGFRLNLLPLLKRPCSRFLASPLRELASPAGGGHAADPEGGDGTAGKGGRLSIVLCWGGEGGGAWRGGTAEDGSWSWPLAGFVAVQVNPASRVAGVGS